MPAHLVLARVLIAQDRPGPALTLQRLLGAANRTQAAARGRQLGLIL